MRSDATSHTRRRAAVATAVVVLACAAGCSYRPESPFSGLTPAQARAVSAERAAARDDVLRADLRSALDRRRPRNVLILSGGDADGAFGCGVLDGWGRRPGGRPRFDVVTGVSTGALIATFAFLGEPADHAALRAVYTTVRDRDVFTGPFDLGPPNSVFDTTPLRRLIAAAVTPEVFRRVAAAHADGRRLYVSTVELESGETYVWPLSKLAYDAVGPAGGTASESDPGLARFRDVLLAAAAIPVLFPPVEIDRGLHADAGLREAVTLRRFMLGLRRAAALAVGADGTDGGATDDGAAGPPVVWAIVNGKLRGPPETVGNNVASIGVRSLTLYTESLVLLSLRDAAHVAGARGAGFRFRWICEPDDLDPRAGGSVLPAMFDPAVTRQLYAAGEGLGGSGSWHDGPPPLDADADTDAAPDVPEMNAAEGVARDTTP
ncbi:MAG: hypothetical protein JWO31_483 [Phycisphaerales bacterium]|nr:hypothetical protein [Phycisphaerales bacterium]